jgi:hypothetical protein
MKTEMDALALDERQRVCWLYANRALVFVVGIVWLGMIAWEIWHHRLPIFMIIMVPAFALIRFLAFMIYAKRI